MGDCTVIDEVAVSLFITMMVSRSEAAQSKIIFNHVILDGQKPSLLLPRFLFHPLVQDFQSLNARRLWQIVSPDSVIRMASIHQK